MKDLTFLLPAYNEEKSIGSLISSIIEIYPYSKIIVIDNNSTDETAKIASELGVEVITEKKQGKSHAIQKGFEHCNSEFIVMLDADNTYDPKDASKLLKPLQKKEADLVLGSRLIGEKEKGSISKINTIGNHIISFNASLFFNPISDVCTGYWAFNKKVVDHLLKVGIKCSGFELEAEMFAKISKANFKITEVPIIYKNRIDEPKLNSLKDGWKIIKTLWIYKLEYRS